jgi:hypothetical protein
MTAAPLTDDELRAITTASAGLRGTFVHMPATGNVVFSPRDSDELHTIAEDLEPHVAESLVVMLDAVPRLLAEVVTLRAQAAEADRDAEAAAGGLPIPLGEMPAGSTTRKLVIANRLLIHERDRVTVTAGGWKRAFIEMRRRRDAARFEVLQLGADLDNMAARETAPLRTEVAQLTQERDDARADVEAADGRLLGVMDGTFSVGDGTEPDASVLTAPHRCDCCSVTIPAGDSAVMFEDENGRACWAHYARCPEPEMWMIEYVPRSSRRRDWCRVIDGQTGDDLARPYEEAIYRARDLGARTRVRLVRVRKEAAGG